MTRRQHGKELATLYVRVATDAKAWLESAAARRGVSTAFIIDEMLMKARQKARRK